MVISKSPDLGKYLKDDSGKRYASSWFMKKSQQSASSGSHGDIAQEPGKQRGFVALYEHASESKAWAARANPHDPEANNGSGPGVELQGVENLHRGIHVRNEIRAEYS